MPGQDLIKGEKKKCKKKEKLKAKLNFSTNFKNKLVQITRKAKKEVEQINNEELRLSVNYLQK